MNASRPHPGRFITFEGGEGAGKSTQIRLLSDALEKAGYAVLQTREPGGSPGAEEIRALLVTGDGDRWTGMTEVLLHFAARADHLERVVRPALSEGKWVLCDRFVDSSMAYQGVAQSLGKDVIRDLTNLVVGTTMPDLTLILDLPVADGLTRAGARGEGEDRYEKMGQAFHEALRQAFLDIATDEPQRCKVIDATADINAVQQAIWAETATRFDL
ncbi:thymidylate kinase [Rhodobiaceae bacterium]|nr:thymidylate kinase [Rhodobiaceae bacterium]